MDNLQNLSVINEKKYPVTKLWMFKAPLIFLAINIVAMLFGYIYPYLLLAMIIALIVNPLIRANFHYSLDDKIFFVKQGVISKKQRSLPYGVIQNVFVKQDLFDRLFKLASLRVENASNSNKKSGFFSLSGNQMGKTGYQDAIGVSGNKVSIPGLKKQDAEELKMAILQKMKDNPIEDSQSGL